MKRIKTKRGFTLIELLLSLAIIGVLSAISLPVLSRVQTKNDLDTATIALVSSLRRASVLSQSVDGDSGWGVYIQSGSITLFKGSSFAARDASRDEVYPLPSTIISSGITEIILSKFTGYPVSPGSTTLGSSVSPVDIATVTMNAKGMVEY